LRELLNNKHDSILFVQLVKMIP